MNRRGFLGMMCGAAVMPPKEFLKVFEPTSNLVWVEFHEINGRLFADLINKSKIPLSIEISWLTPDSPSEVTLTVNGEKSIIRKWSSPTF